MLELLLSLQGLLLAIWAVVVAIGQLGISHWFLLAWIGYFTFAVHWPKTFEVFSKGGWVAATLVSAAVITLLAKLSQTALQQTSLFGFDVNPMAGTISVGILYLAIAFLCGSIQMSGLPARLLGWFERRTQNVVSTD